MSTMTIQKAVEHFSDHQRTPDQKKCPEGYETLLELQARCGLRIGEVLKLRVSDISGRKHMIQEPQSGRVSKLPSCPSI